MSVLPKLKITKIIAILLSILLLWDSAVWANPEFFQKSKLSAWSMFQQEESCLRIADVYLSQYLAWTEQDPYYRNLHNIKVSARDAVKLLQEDESLRKVLPEDFLQRLPQDIVRQLPVKEDVVIDLGPVRIRYFNPNISDPDADNLYEVRRTEELGKYLVKQTLVRRKQKDAAGRIMRLREDPEQGKLDFDDIYFELKKQLPYLKDKKRRFIDIRENSGIELRSKLAREFFAKVDVSDLPAAEKKRLRNAIRIFEKLNIIEFDAIVLPLRTDGTKARAWLTGFNTYLFSETIEPDSRDNSLTVLLREIFGDTIGLSAQVLDVIMRGKKYGELEMPEKLVLQEYVFHEVICPFFGHKEARKIQEKLFRENYKGIQGDSTAGQQDGELGLVTRKVINDKLEYASSKPSTGKKIVSEVRKMGFRGEGPGKIVDLAARFEEWYQRIKVKQSRFYRGWDNSGIKRFLGKNSIEEWLHYIRTKKEWILKLAPHWKKIQQALESQDAAVAQSHAVELMNEHQRLFNLFRNRQAKYILKDKSIEKAISDARKIAAAVGDLREKAKNPRWPAIAGFLERIIVDLAIASVLSVVLYLVLPVNWFTKTAAIIIPLTVFLISFFRGLTRKNFLPRLVFAAAFIAIISIFPAMPWLGLSLAVIIMIRMVRREGFISTKPLFGRKGVRKIPVKDTWEKDAAGKEAELVNYANISADIFQLISTIMKLKYRGKPPEGKSLSADNLTETIIESIFDIEPPETLPDTNELKIELRKLVGEAIKKMERNLEFQFELKQAVKKLEDWRNKNDDELARALNDVSQEVVSILGSRGDKSDKNEMLAVRELIAEHYGIPEDRFLKIRMRLWLILVREDIASKEMLGFKVEPENYYVLGILEFHFKEHTKAETAFAKAAKNNGMNKEHLFTLAVVQHLLAEKNESKYEEAVQPYTYSLNLRKMNESPSDIDKLMLELNQLLLEKAKRRIPISGKRKKRRSWEDGDDGAPLSGAIGKEYEQIKFERIENNKLHVSAINKKEKRIESMSLDICDQTSLSEELMGKVVSAADGLYHPLVRRILVNVPANVKFYVFDHPKEDKRRLSGFVPNNKNLVALQKIFSDDPVAVFHEIGEYLIKQPFFGLSLEGGTLVLSINDKVVKIDVEEAISTLVEDGEEWAKLRDMELNYPKNKHYLLRILQRELFGRKDRELTLKINFWQRKMPSVEVIKHGDEYLVEVDPALKITSEGGIVKDMESAMGEMIKVPQTVPEEEILDIQRMFYTAAALELISKTMRGFDEASLVIWSERFREEANEKLERLGIKIEKLAAKVPTRPSRKVRGRTAAFMAGDMNEAIVTKNGEKLEKLVQRTKAKHKTVVFDKDEPARACVGFTLYIGQNGEIVEGKEAAKEEAHLLLGVNDNLLKFTAKGAHDNVVKAVAKYNRKIFLGGKRGDSKAPGSIWSLDEDYAVNKAPKIEEGIFTALPFAVLTVLNFLGKITTLGFAAWMGISYAVFIGAHLINFFRAPPIIKKEGFLETLRWAFRVPVTVAFIDFIISSIGIAFIYRIIPVATSFLEAIPAFAIILCLVYLINSFFHKTLNYMAIDADDRAPAAVGITEGDGHASAPGRRSRKFFEDSKTMEVPSSELYRLARHYKTKELMKIVHILEQDIEKNKSMISYILNFIIERKERRYREIQEEARRQMELNDTSVKILPDRHGEIYPESAMAFALSLPQYLRDLIPIHRPIEELAFYPYMVKGIDRKVIEFVKNKLPPENRRSATYYGAGMDILTPIKALKGLTGTIRYVDINSYDRLFYAGVSYLRQIFAPHGIEVLSIDEQNKKIFIKVDHENITLEFHQWDNASFAKNQYCVDKGDTLVYMHSLTGFPSELWPFHLGSNKEGIFVFCPGEYAHFDGYKIYSERISENTFFIRSGTELSQITEERQKLTGKKGLPEPGHGPGAGPIIEEPNNKVREAEKLIKQERFEEAIELLDEAVRQYKGICDERKDEDAGTLGHQMAQAAHENMLKAQKLLQQVPSHTPAVLAKGDVSFKELQDGEVSLSSKNLSAMYIGSMNTLLKRLGSRIKERSSDGETAVLEGGGVRVTIYKRKADKGRPFWACRKEDLEKVERICGFEKRTPETVMHRSKKRSMGEGIRGAYSDLMEGRKEEVCLGDISCFVNMKQGILYKSFPTPDGKNLEKERKIGLRQNISSITLTAKKDERGKIRLIFDFVKKEEDKEEKGRAVLVWTLDEEKDKHVFLKEDEYLKRMIKEACRDVTEGEEIYIGDIISLISIEPGLLHPSFPTPDGKEINEQKGFGAGRDPITVVLTVKKDEKGLIRLVLDYTKNKKGRGGRKKGRSVLIWSWDEEKKKFCFLKEKEFLRRKIKRAYKDLAEGKVNEVYIEDASPLVGMSAGWMYSDFPTPEGRVAGKIKKIGIGINSHSVTLKIRKDKDGRIKLVFKRENEKTATLIWAWDETKTRNVFFRESGFVKRKIEDAYNSVAGGKIEEVNIGDVSSLVTMGSGSIHKNFPMPDGKTTDKHMQIGSGYDLSSVALVVKKDEKDRIQLVFDYVREKAHRGGKKKGRAVLVWVRDEISNRKVFVTKDKLLKMKIRKAYQDLARGETNVAEIGDVSSLVKMEDGSINLTFPAPDGKMLEKRQMIGTGGNLSSLDLMVKKDAEGRIQLVFDYVKKKAGRDRRMQGRTVLIWDWDEKEKRNELFREDEFVKRKIEKAYKDVISGEAEEIEVRDVRALLCTKVNMLRGFFPLPNGKDLGSAKFLAIGENLSSVTLTVKKDEEGRIQLVFDYETMKAGKDEKEKGQAILVWAWDEGEGEKVLFRESDFLRVEIRKAYKDVLEGKREEVHVGEIGPLVSKIYGDLNPSFPTPDGKIIGKQISIGTGQNLSSVSLIVKKDEEARIRLVFDYEKKIKDKDGEKKGKAVLVWVWDGEKKKYVFLREDEFTRRKLRKAYEEIAKGKDIHVGDINSLVCMRYGWISKTFPAPNKRPINEQVPIGTGPDLSSITLTLKKDAENQIRLVFDYAKENGEKGQAILVWDEENGIFIGKDKFEKSQNLRVLFLRGRVFEEIVRKLYKNAYGKRLEFEKQFIVSELAQECRYPDYFVDTVLIADAKLGRAGQNIVDTILRYTRLRRTLGFKKEKLKIIVLYSDLVNEIKDALANAKVEGLESEFVTFSDLIDALRPDRELESEVYQNLDSLGRCKGNLNSLIDLYSSIKGEDSERKIQGISIMREEEWQSHLIENYLNSRDGPGKLIIALKALADNHSLFWEWFYHMKLITFLSYIYDKLDQTDFKEDKKEEIRRIILSMYPGIEESKGMWREITQYYKLLASDREKAAEEISDELERRQVLFQAMDEEENKIWKWADIRVDRFDFNEFKKRIKTKIAGLKNRSANRGKDISVVDIWPLKEDETRSDTDKSPEISPVIKQTLSLTEKSAPEYKILRLVGSIKHPYFYFDKLRDYLVENLDEIREWPESRRAKLVRIVVLAFTQYFTSVERYRKFPEFERFKEQIMEVTLSEFLKALEERGDAKVIKEVKKLTGIRLKKEIEEFVEALETGKDGLSEPGHGPGAGPIIEEPNNKVREAEKLIKQERFEEAIELLDEAVRQYKGICDERKDEEAGTLGHQMAQAALGNMLKAEGLLRKITRRATEAAGYVEGAEPEKEARIYGWLDEAESGLRTNFCGMAVTAVNRILAHIAGHPDIETDPKGRLNYRKRLKTVLLELAEKKIASPRMQILLRGLEAGKKESEIRERLSLVDELQEMDVAQISKLGEEALDKYVKDLWLDEVQVWGDSKNPSIIDKRYTLTGIILNRGSFSEVRVAVDRETSRKVAIRILKRGQGRVNILSFLRGYTLLRDLEDTYGVIDAYSSGYWKDKAGNERYYTVMEIATGRSLGAILKQGYELTFKDMFTITKAIMGILEDMHDKGVVHGDLTSENILIDIIGRDEEGRPIYDFANPKLTDYDHSVRLPETGAVEFEKIAGNLHYLPPEIFPRPGKGGSTIKGRGTRGTDLYEAGCVLYRLLAGRLPFEEKGNQYSWAKKIKEEAPDVRSFNRNIPEALAGFVMKLIKKNPDDRFASAVEAKGAMERSEEEMLTPPAPPKDLASRTEIYAVKISGQRTILERKEDISERVRSGKVEVVQGYVGIAELAEGEEMFTESLYDCFGFIARGKKEDGRIVHILGHLLPMQHDIQLIGEEMDAVTSFVKGQGITTLEIYFNGSEVMRPKIMASLVKIREDLREAGIETAVDPLKNDWRKDIVPAGKNMPGLATYGSAALTAKGFVSKERDLDGTEEVMPHDWGRLPDAKQFRHPYSDVREGISSGLRARVLEAIKKKIGGERVVGKFAQGMIDLAGSAPAKSAAAPAKDKEERERIVLALDLDMGEEDINKLFEELVKVLLPFKEQNGELALFLDNLEIIPGRGKKFADRLKGIKAKQENIIIITPNAEYYKDLTQATIAQIDKNGFPKGAYMPLLEIMLFAVIKHMASKNSPDITKEQLLYYYQLIPNVLLVDELGEDDYADLFDNLAARRFVIRLIPNAVPLSGEVGELRDSLMTALKRA